MNNWPRAYSFKFIGYWKCNFPITRFVGLVRRGRVADVNHAACVLTDLNRLACRAEQREVEDGYRYAQNLK